MLLKGLSKPSNPERLVNLCSVLWQNGKGHGCRKLERNDMRYTIDQEVERRRTLLRLAARGNVQARKELAAEYHARVYSAAQLARYTPNVEHSSVSAAVQRTLDSLLDVENDAA
jgi:hypothetical protein